MREHIEQTQNWIRRVQRSSDKTKRVWLVVLSGSCMLFIIFFWLMYLSFTMPKLNGNSKEEKAGAPFWQALSEGIRVIGGRTWEELTNVKEEILNFRGGAERIINNFSNEFTIEGDRNN